MAEYAENGLALRWDDAAEAAAGALAGTRRVLVTLAPAHPANALRALCAMDGGPLREVRGFAQGRDAASGAQLFALDLPEPPPGGVLGWWPVASCSGREADPRRAGLPPTPLAAPAPAAPPAAPRPEADPAFPQVLERLGRVTIPLRQKPEVIGRTPDGLRIVFPLAEGGTVRGPRLNGEVLPTGGDWMLVREDGVGVCDARILIRTPQGALVEALYGGVADFGPDGFAEMSAGRHPPRIPVQFAPRLVSAEPALAWLNRVQCLGVGRVTMASLLVEYDLYAVHSRAADPG